MLKDNLKKLRKLRRMTLEELADAIGTSKQTIHRYENGVISNIPADKVLKLAEALEVSPAELMGWDGEDFSSFNYSNVMPYSVKRIPMLGSIACGAPIFAEEEHESFVSVGDGIDADFCLRASGDSMMGARIFDGDIVFIRKQETVDNGEIAAVIINDEATLKRVYYYPTEDKIVLSPENPRYAPLVYIRDELDTIKILGKAVAFQSTVV